MEINAQIPVDSNNNVKVVIDRNNSTNNIGNTENKTTFSSEEHQNDDVQRVTPTKYLFQNLGTPQQLSVPSGVTDLDVYRQSYIEPPGGYNQQQHQQFINQESPQQHVPLNNSNQVSGFGQYVQYEQAVEDEQYAAEHLASELCSTYGGHNSHMISDILKRNVGQNYVHGGFERPSAIETMQHFDNIPSNQHDLQDVDLLNTPQQLPADDEVCSDVYETQRERFGDPRASSTPDVPFQKNRIPESDTNFQSSVTYNDIHVHGGRWSRQKSPVYEQHVEPESPFPNAGKDNLYGSTNRQETHPIESRVVSHVASRGDSNILPSNNENFLDIAKHTPVHDDDIHQVPDSDQFGGFKSPGSHNGSGFGHPQHEITKMTFTPREMMETHLSQNYKYPKKSTYGQQVSEYSSIYPSREFIERATNQNGMKTKSDQIDQSERLPPKKRPRISKYSTEEVPRVPPQMPIFDNMFQKYVPYLPRDEIHGGKHKYFVVNPSEISHMPPKTLLSKYVDFLISENEQITAISKSTNPPVDIYVTEDMYFMDSLKFKVPFPSKKFAEWVASFYPRLNFPEMKFKGRFPVIPREGQGYVPDPRPTQEILEDTFYYFQREAMNLERS